MGRLRVERNVSRGQLISYVMRREREEAPWIFMRGRDVGMCLVSSVQCEGGSWLALHQHCAIHNTTEQQAMWACLIIVGAGM